MKAHTVAVIVAICGVLTPVVTCAGHYLTKYDISLCTSRVWGVDETLPERLR